MAAHRHFLPSALGIALALALPALPLHAEPDAVAATYASSHEADLRLLYGEAASIGPETYVYRLYLSSDEAAARALAAQLGADPALTLSGLRPLPARRQRAYATPAPLREQLRHLKPGQTSPLFQPLKGQWALVELQAVEAGAAMPPFEALRDSLPLLVTTGALPDPKTLHGNTETEERTQLTQVVTTQGFDDLRPGVDVDAPMVSGYTMLQRALREDNVALVKALLTRKADPDLCRMDVCPLQLAFKSPANAPQFVALLLEAGAHPDRMPDQPGQDSLLVQVCQAGRLDLAAALLDKGADVNAAKSTHKPVEIALATGNVELLRLLLAHGLDPNGKNSATSPLHVALAAGNRELAQLLLDKGADPLQSRPLSGDTKTGTPLLSALAAGKPEVAAWFRGEILKKLATRGEYRWSAWIEQEVLAPPSRDPNAVGPLVRIIKTPLKPGARIALNRERFTLNVRLAPQATLRLEAATGPQLFNELQSLAPTPPLLDRTRLKPGRGGALLVGDARARAANPAGTGGVLAWSGKDFDQVQKSAEGTTYVRIIDRVKLDNGGGTPAEVALEQSGLRELDLVLGTGVDYSDTLGDFVNPQKITLVFK